MGDHESSLAHAADAQRVTGCLVFAGHDTALGATSRRIDFDFVSSVAKTCLRSHIDLSEPSLTPSLR
jgi:hypothetical protein